MTSFIWSKIQKKNFHIGRNVALNFSKPFKLINKNTVTHLKNPRQCII